ncbi:hypothetical protein BDR07DRAFT_1408866 [Suillus spraguei]|nr:hypothetical protein BDR07DRAFT_1408866 [Suillus spraguei]
MKFTSLANVVITAIAMAGAVTASVIEVISPDLPGGPQPDGPPPPCPPPGAPPVPGCAIPAKRDIPEEGVPLQKAVPPEAGVAVPKAGAAVHK